MNGLLSLSSLIWSIKPKVHEHIVRFGAKEKRIEGITAVRDESNREGVRFVIEVR